MAALTLYGSSIADTTITTACKMAANTAGGTETSKQSTIPSTSNTYAEVLSQAGTSNSVTAIPATPTGKGYVYQPGAGTFANAAWGAILTFAHAAGTTSDVTIRFFKYTGSYSLIGSINRATNTQAKTTYTYTNTTMPSTTFAASDLLYIDLWYHDSNANVGLDNPTIYVSNSSTVGVANDLQITTSDFTPSAVHQSICDGYGGVFS